VRDHVRQAFVDAKVAFEHIFTYGGSPVATAAGLAVLDIYRREKLVEHVEELEPALASNLQGLRDFAFIGDVRTLGFMAGIEFVADPVTRAPFPPATKVAVRVREAGLRNGIVTYPGTGMADGKSGDIISLYPPLTFTLDDIADLGERLRATFADVEAELKAAGA
jgi:adenosylmethionine-8-amino-7-oxononanoate aminotransferase